MLRRMIDADDSILVLVVADDPLARAGLAALLAEMETCTVVGQLSSGEALAELPADFTVDRPDVILWDLGWEPSEPLPDWSDLDLPVVLLADEAPALEAESDLAYAILHRRSEPERLLLAMEAVLAGLVVLEPDFVTTAVATPLTGDFPIEPLTPRELEVLQHLAEGLTNRAIAARLDISDHTVKFHLNAILGKLGAQSRTEAVVRATRLGLIVL